MTSPEGPTTIRAAGSSMMLSLSTILYSPPWSYKGGRTGPLRGRSFSNSNSHTHRNLSGLGMMGPAQAQAPDLPDQTTTIVLKHLTEDLGHRSLSRPFVTPYYKPVQHTRAAANWM